MYNVAWFQTFIIKAWLVEGQKPFENDNILHMIKFICILKFLFFFTMMRLCVHTNHVRI